MAHTLFAMTVLVAFYALVMPDVAVRLLGIGAIAIVFAFAAVPVDAATGRALIVRLALAAGVGLEIAHLLGRTPSGYLPSANVDHGTFDAQIGISVAY